MWKWPRNRVPRSKTPSPIEKGRPTLPPSRIEQSTQTDPERHERGTQTVPEPQGRGTQTNPGDLLALGSKDLFSSDTTARRLEAGLPAEEEISERIGYVPAQAPTQVQASQRQSRQPGELTVESTNQGEGSKTAASQKHAAGSSRSRHSQGSVNLHSIQAQLFTPALGRPRSGSSRSHASSNSCQTPPLPVPGAYVESGLGGTVPDAPTPTRHHSEPPLDSDPSRVALMAEDDHWAHFRDSLRVVGDKHPGGRSGYVVEFVLRVLQTELAAGIVWALVVVVRTFGGYRATIWFLAVPVAPTLLLTVLALLTPGSFQKPRFLLGELLNTAAWLAFVMVIKIEPLIDAGSQEDPKAPLATRGRAHGILMWFGVGVISVSGVFILLRAVQCLVGRAEGVLACFGRLVGSSKSIPKQ